MTSIVLVGIGGYGGLTAAAVLAGAADHGCTVIGAVEPFPDQSPVIEQLKEQCIPVYAALEEFYNSNSADLAILSTPIYLHEEQAVYCMAHGSDVLCEKPVAATLQSAKAMEQAAKRYNKNLHIGFQLSFAPDVLQLKKRILAGEFGKMIQSLSCICWPRNKQYYARPWAAKARLNGAYVLDSIAMNACAHYLHLPFFLAGDALNTVAKPLAMRVGLKKANDIETYDTVCMEINTTANLPILFLATHAGKTVSENPLVKLTFEKAVVTFSENSGDKAICIRYQDGREEFAGKTYDDRYEKVWYAVDVFRKEKEPLCGVNEALSHLKCVNAASEFAPVTAFKNVEEEDGLRFVPGLDELLTKAYSTGVLPWELFTPTEIRDLDRYETFGGLYS